MKITFSRPLAYSKDYPEPIIKGLMNLRLTDLLFKKEHYVTDSSFFAINGRSGLAIIGKHLRLKKGDTILLPSYHCPALVEPFIWLGVNIRFYNLNKDLSVDIDDFSYKMDDSVKVCLFVHFFGFPPDFTNLLALLKNKNISIIEDCAHSFYAPLLKRSQSIADFSVVSCNKFFPCVDGSIVYGIKDPALREGLVNASLFSDFKTLLNQLPLTAQLIEMTKRIFFGSGNDKKIPVSIAANDINSFRYFSPDEINQSCSRVSKYIVEHTNHKDLMKKRRENFCYLLKKLINSSKGKPLFTTLPDDVVPYVFPFILNESQYFDDMKNYGLSLFRWEELAESSCANSHYYRKNLVQIPCHQGLSQKDLDVIVKIVQ